MYIYKLKTHSRVIYCVFYGSCKGQQYSPIKKAAKKVQRHCTALCDYMLCLYNNVAHSDKFIS